MIFKHASHTRKGVQPLLTDDLSLNYPWISLLDGYADHIHGETPDNSASAPERDQEDNSDGSSRVVCPKFGHSVLSSDIYLLS